MKNRDQKQGVERLIDIDGLQAYLSVGKNTAEKVGRTAGALIRIGRRALYDRRKIDAYIDSLEE